MKGVRSRVLTEKVFHQLLWYLWTRSWIRHSCFELMEKLIHAYLFIFFHWFFSALSSLLNYTHWFFFELRQVSQNLQSMLLIFS